MKKGTFRRVSFTMEHANGYGNYIISANYRGKKLSVVTTDSEAWDYLDDDLNRKKQQEARKHCYFKIVSAYFDL